MQTRSPALSHRNSQHTFTVEGGTKTEKGLGQSRTRRGPGKKLCGLDRLERYLADEWGELGLGRRGRGKTAINAPGPGPGLNVESLPSTG